jgi:hypothetical protein
LTPNMQMCDDSIIKLDQKSKKSKVSAVRGGACAPCRRPRRRPRRCRRRFRRRFNRRFRRTRRRCCFRSRLFSFSRRLERSIPDRWGEMTKKQRKYWKDRHWGCSREEEGAGRSVPAARKEGRLRAPPTLRMLSCPDLPRP